MIRVLIVDDHDRFREGLKALLQHLPGVRIVGEASSGRAGIALARARTPDVVLMDVTMPDIGGVEATRQIVDACAATRVLGLSMHSDRRFVSHMFEAGAKGYLLKDFVFDELDEALRTVAAGQLYVCRALREA